MANANRTRDWEQEDQPAYRNRNINDERGYRGNDERDNGGYLHADPPYEGLVGELTVLDPDAARGPHYGIGPAGYTRSDRLIDEDINDHLTDHSYIDATEITVSVKDGAVTLEGSVPDRDQKYYAEEVAEKVHGVKGVNNLLKVKKPQNDLLQNPTGKQ